MARNTDATDAEERYDNLLDNTQKEEMRVHFEDYEFEYREDDDTDAEVVYEDEDWIVVADHSGHELNEWAGAFSIDSRELSEEFHKIARDLCDYSWSVSDPVLFHKAGRL